MNKEPIFSRKLLLAFVGFALCAFALSIYLMGREDYGSDQIGPSSFSTSALGYAGIADVLEQLGVPVVKSRRNPSAEADSGVLVVAEPQLHLLPQMVLPVLPDAETILLILPKWHGADKGERQEWIGRAYPVAVLQVQRVLGLAVDQPQIEKREKVENWSVNEIGVAPGLSGHTQLMKSDALRPLVASDGGILLGAVQKDDQLIWVLSDPDVIANHAFDPEGKGGAFAVALVEKLRAGSGPVVFDETVHGFQSRPAAILRLLLQFPYSILTLQVVLGAALILWATMGRFGPPATPPPPLGTGKAGLIGNVADLMEYAGHERLIIRRYVENTIRETARQLRAPKNLTYAETVDWLSRLGERRKLTADCRSLAHLAHDLADGKGQIDISKFADAARKIHQWKQEIVDGPSTHPRHH